MRALFAGDGDDLPAGGGEVPAVPVAVLGLDLKAGAGEERAERLGAGGAQAGAVDAEHGAVGPGRGLGEGDHIAGDGLDLVPDAQGAAGRVGDVRSV